MSNDAAAIGSPALQSMGGPAPQTPVLALMASQLHVIAPDGIVPREALASLQTASGVLRAAREEASRIVADGARRAAELHERAKADGQAWLAERERELQAQMALRQSEWLAELQPTWLAALERCLKRLCGESLRADVLAGAIETGLRHFESLAGLRLMVAPGELDHARGALARLATTEARQLRIESDAALEPGSCRLRGPQLEVTLELDRAVELVLGKL